MSFTTIWNSQNFPVHLHPHIHKQGPGVPDITKFLDNSVVFCFFFVCVYVCFHLVTHLALSRDSPRRQLATEFQSEIVVLQESLPNRSAFRNLLQEADQGQKKVHVVGKCPGLLWMERICGLLALRLLQAFPSHTSPTLREQQSHEGKQFLRRYIKGKATKIGLLES